MASDAPQPSERHKVTIVLDGSNLKGTDKARRAKYKAYMKKVRSLAKTLKAAVLKPELYLKQSAITARKKKAMKPAGRKSRRSRGK